MTNEINQLVIERDSALERVEQGQTEKEQLQVRISDLEVRDGNPTLCPYIDALVRRTVLYKCRHELQLKSRRTRLKSCGMGLWRKSQICK